MTENEYNAIKQNYHYLHNRITSEIYDMMTLLKRNLSYDEICLSIKTANEKFFTDIEEKMCKSNGESFPLKKYEACKQCKNAEDKSRWYYTCRICLPNINNMFINSLKNKEEK